MGILLVMGFEDGGRIGGFFPGMGRFHGLLVEMVWSHLDIDHLIECHIRIQDLNLWELDTGS